MYREGRIGAKAEDYGAGNQQTYDSNATTFSGVYALKIITILNT